MNVLATVRAGFVGANLRPALAEAVNDRVVLDDRSRCNKENLRVLDVEVVVGCILDPPLADALVTTVDWFRRERSAW